MSTVVPTAKECEATLAAFGHMVEARHPEQDFFKTLAILSQGLLTTVLRMAPAEVRSEMLGEMLAAVTRTVEIPGAEMHFLPDDGSDAVVN